VDDQGAPKKNRVQTNRVVVIVDHGSRNPAANAVVAEVARLVQIRAGDGADVRFAHLELSEPSLPRAIDECVARGATHVMVQPLFLGPGKHASRDIPELVADARRRHPDVEFELGRVIGADPLLADIVWARCSS
jgi:sirohydrochlorin ferrochelatase